MQSLILLGWAAICVCLALMNVNYFRLAPKQRLLGIFCLMVSGNVIWIFLNYGTVVQARTYNFLAQWFIVHGVTTAVAPIIFSRIRLHPLQYLGFVIMATGILIIFWPRGGAA
jgi:hypothetical protein